MGVITTAVGTALTLGAASTAAGTGVAGLSLASTIGVAGLGIGGGLLAYGASKMMKGGKQEQAGAQAPAFDQAAEQRKAQTAADEEEKRRRVAMAKSKTKYTDPVFGQEEPITQQAGLLGA